MMTKAQEKKLRVDLLDTLTNASKLADQLANIADEAMDVRKVKMYETTILAINLLKEKVQQLE